MAKINITATNVMSSSDAYRELFNRDGLQVYAMKKGRFQIKCGSTHKVVRNTQELQEGIDGLGLHQFPHSGESVVSEINEKLSSTYRLEVRASNDKVIHMIEGSKDKILGECIGTISVDKNMVPGRRYACNGIFGGDYMILVPMSAGSMCLDDSFSIGAGDQMYEKQEFAKGIIVIGQNPLDGSTMTVLVDEVYPNGAFKDSEGIVWPKEDIKVYKFEVGRPTTNEDFKAPSESLYTEEDIPTYNPVGDVSKVAPMIGDLKNYDSILSASAGILSDFMKTAKSVAYIDRSSLNKVKISGINPEGQATDGEIEWNVRICSPHYKRSSSIMIPMVMKEGSIDLGKEFTASTGLKYPMTTEAIKEHLGTLIEDFEKKCRGSRYPSTLKADKDVDNLMNGIEGSEKASEYNWVSKDGKIGIINTFHDYTIVYIPTDESKGMGDGVDMFMDEEGNALSPDTPEFDAQMAEYVNDPVLIEAYFPDVKEVEGSKKTGALDTECPVCGSNNISTAEVIHKGQSKGEQGVSECKDCGKVWVNKSGKEGSKKVAGKKVYRIRQGIGTGKYDVSFYDGAQTHPDGSAFFNLKIFKNKKDLSAFEQKLINEGYVEQGYDWKDEAYDKTRAETLQEMNLEQQEVNLYTNISEQDIKDRMNRDREKQGSKKVSASTDYEGTVYVDGKAVSFSYFGGPEISKDIYYALDEEAKNRATEMIAEGYSEGELNYDNEIRGYWQVVKEDSKKSSGSAKTKRPDLGSYGGKKEGAAKLRAVLSESGANRDYEEAAGPVPKDGMKLRSLGVYGKGLRDGEVYTLKQSGQGIFDFIKNGRVVHRNTFDTISRWLYQVSQGDRNGLELVTEGSDAGCGKSAVRKLRAAEEDMTPAAVQRWRDVTGSDPMTEPDNPFVKGKSPAPSSPKGKGKAEASRKTAEYQPKTGEPCSCKPGIQRDNCPACEGTGMKIDFKKIRDTNNPAKKTAEVGVDKNYVLTVKHDNGTVNIQTSAQSEEGAINKVMQSEGCPRRSIVKVTEASKKTAAAGEPIEVGYYWIVNADVDESSARETGLNLEADNYEAVSSAVMQVEFNVEKWLKQNLGAASNTGSDEYGLGGSLWVEKGSPQHKFVMAGLRDNGEESFATSSGTMPMDDDVLFAGVENKFSSVLNVDLYFMRMTNQPPENNDYSDEPEGDSSAIETVSKTESIKTAADTLPDDLSFDFTSNQDLKVGDEVLANGKKVKITNLHRVQDVYSSEEDFNAYQDLYQNSGLTWEGNQIMTVDADSDGIEVEHFVYELEKAGVEGSKKVAMEPGHGFQVEAEPGRYYTGTFTDWMNNGESVPFAVANADEIPPSSKDIRTTNANSSEEAIKVRFGSKKVATSVPDQHQLKILKDTVRNPNKGLFLGGPSAEESEQILRTKFNYTDKQIEQLKTGSIKKADTSDDVLNAKTLDQLKAAVEALGYTVDENDVITASGRFENEHISTVFYNEGYMAGDQGEDFLDFGEGETVIFYKVTPEEQKMFETSEPYFALTSSTQGFIGGAFVSEEQHKVSVEEYEKFETESGEEGMPLASKTAASQAWDVVLDGKIIDTVWDIETDPAEVKRSLVGHDGYDPNIVVQKPQKKGSIKTAEVAEPDLAAFRENPDDFGVPAAIAQNWNDDEIKVYLEEKMYSSEHYPALAAAKPKPEKIKPKGNLLVAYDSSDVYSNQVESNIEQIKADPESYGLDSKDLSDETVKAKAEELAAGDSDVQQMAWDDEMSILDEVITNANKASGNDGWWDVEGRNMGWQQRSGEMKIQINNHDEFLKIFPKTQDVSFEVRDGGQNTLDVTIWHHDAPTGEFRTLIPTTAPDDTMASKTAALNPQAKYAVMSTFNGTSDEMKTQFPDVNFDTEEFTTEDVGGTAQVERIVDGSGLSEYLNKLKTQADKISHILVFDLSEPSGAPMSTAAKQMEFDGWNDIDKNLLS